MLLTFDSFPPVPGEIHPTEMFNSMLASAHSTEELSNTATYLGRTVADSLIAVAPIDLKSNGIGHIWNLIDPLWKSHDALSRTPAHTAFIKGVIGSIMDWNEKFAQTEIGVAT